MPANSLHLLASLNLSSQARIIDIGGGDSLLVDHLVATGYRHVTVLDLSAAALAPPGPAWASGRGPCAGWWATY